MKLRFQAIYSKQNNILCLSGSIIVALQVMLKWVNFYQDKFSWYNFEKLIRTLHLFARQICLNGPPILGKVSKVLYTFCLYLRLPAIVNLIFHTMRLENLMMSHRDKLYITTSSSIFWLLYLAKCSPANVCVCLALSQK